MIFCLLLPDIDPVNVGAYTAHVKCRQNMTLKTRCSTSIGDASPASRRPRFGAAHVPALSSTVIATTCPRFRRVQYDMPPRTLMPLTRQRTLAG